MRKTLMIVESVVAALVVLVCVGLGGQVAAWLGAELPSWAQVAVVLVGMFGGYGVGRALVRRYYRIA
ncbi:hypothetical protein RB608_00375 [Nocardioides sp. LHD-245]|uniref:hypothetical protein n=1 Tax=Nocardioides sp. LHD-245 TaxID=3051387 RepID=UPI0027E1FB03|nr:hypothetical protein [Nocardioides sp. LHD-245]